jgi:hypothetical protein
MEATMKKICLSQGHYALVDDEDFDFLNKRKWCISKRKNTSYAVRYVTKTDGSRHPIFMHRAIMGTPKGFDTDHKDGNGLNNKRGNLRVCTKSENQRNRISRVGSSLFKGVSIKNQTGRWVSQIRFNGKKMHLGYFSNQFDAARKYNEFASKLYGEFANLNNIPKEA